MSDAYEKRVTWLFGDGDWEVTDFGSSWVSIEETRKNGQEDTHIAMIVERGKDGKWLVTEGLDMINTYGGGEADVEAIQSHLNEHGVPGKLS